MASLWTMNYGQWQMTVANWQLTMTVTMTKLIDKDSKKESKIDLMPKLYCICYSKEFLLNCIIRILGNQFL